MTPDTVYPLEGGCDCGQIRYRMETAPLIVHCCHCHWCQRETGTAFALNALIEAERVIHLKSEPEVIDTPSQSGKGQKIARCPTCRVAVWSNYAGAGPIIRFIRVGTLDTPAALRPDIHIFTASRQPWLVLPQDVPAVPEFYEIERIWSADSLARREGFPGCEPTERRRPAEPPRRPLGRAPWPGGMDRQGWAWRLLPGRSRGHPHRTSLSARRYSRAACAAL